MKGKVYFVGAGPGAPDLLTLRAVRVLRMADIVVHDDLVSAEVLSFAASSALVINVGKRYGKAATAQSHINALMVEQALLGRCVVRLKSGDPAMFGRLGEEIDALRESGIDFEIVPGVTAALAASASAQITLARRAVASNMIFVSATLANGARQTWKAVVRPNSTLVIYMPGPDYAKLAQELLGAGLAGELPCAVVSCTSKRGDAVCVSTISELGEIRVPGPAVIIVGEVVAGARQSAGKAPLGELFAAVTSSQANVIGEGIDFYNRGDLDARQ